MTDETIKPEEEMSEDELIEAAMAAMSEELPPTMEMEEAGAPPEVEQKEIDLKEIMTPEMESAISSTSPTLSALDENRRPSQKTVCERCPHSVWFASPEEVKCYCRVMYLVSWSTKEQNQIINCDGEFLGKE